MPQLPPIDEEYVQQHIRNEAQNRQAPRLPRRADPALPQNLVNDREGYGRHFRVRWQPNNIVIENITNLPFTFFKLWYEKLGPVSMILIPGFIAGLIIFIVDMSLSKRIVNDIIGLSLLLVLNIIWARLWYKNVRPRLIRIRG